MITDEMIMEAMLDNITIDTTVIDTFGANGITGKVFEAIINHTLLNIRHETIIYWVDGDPRNMQNIIIEQIDIDYSNLYRRYITKQMREAKLAKILERSELNRVISSANPLDNPYVRNAQSIDGYESKKIKKMK